ncbi:DUF7079 family protein [Reichenbachiella sp.]|uniref:DUF7079 family protein n=1 Tax=Reichenbachiella sp. TaxID=2184521 RepID=UPI003BB17EC1
MTASSLMDRPVIWKVLSEMYLDTELTERGYDYIATKLNQASCGLKEAQSIDYYEVAPAVGLNLLSTAGVWTAFETSWLNERCQKNMKSKGSWVFMLKCHFLQLLIKGIRRENWKHLTQAIKKVSATK